MHRFTLLISLLLWCVAGAMAGSVWTVETVPNTRLQSNDIHVSDPDGFLSDSAEMHINTALCAIREQADVFVVTLATIGDADPKGFATKLFNHWGIGDAATNNGVLLLFVEDQHALEFETGYGAEETLTDARCQRIFTNTIVPFFKAGDYEGGLCAGVADIVTVYGGEVPLGLKTTLPTGTDGGDDNDLGFWVIVMGGLLVFMPFITLGYLITKLKTKKIDLKSEVYTGTKEDGVTYLNGSTTAWSGSPWDGRGCTSSLMLGFSLFWIGFVVYLVFHLAFPDMEKHQLENRVGIVSVLAYLTWICFRQNHRALKLSNRLAKHTLMPQEVYKKAFKHGATQIATWMAPWLGWVYYLIFKHKIKKSEGCHCPECGEPINQTKVFMLPEKHRVEERIGALRFTPYRCVNGHTYVVKERGGMASTFATCEKCGAFAAKKTKETVLRDADYSHSGEKEVTYECQCCDSIYTAAVIIPMLVRVSHSSSSSSSGRSYSSGSSRSSGGSFGGGRSGGGGYSGRW